MDGCNYSSIGMTPPFNCKPEGDCDITQTCTPFKGMDPECIYALSSQQDRDLRAQGLQWAALCLGGTNTHETDDSGKKNPSMVANAPDANSDGFGIFVSAENAKLQNDYNRPHVARWWAEEHMGDRLTDYDFPQSIEVCNNAKIGAGGLRTSGTWACQSNIKWIDPYTFSHSWYVAHHYLNFLLEKDPTASKDLASRILRGLYLQHVHFRLLQPNGQKGDLNSFDPSKVTDCSQTGDVPSKCPNFKPPDLYWNDKDGQFWSTAVGACLGYDPVTQTRDACGLSDDVLLLQSVASTVVDYYYTNMGTVTTPAYGDESAQQWTDAIDVCLNYDCSQTSSDYVATLDVKAIRLVAKTYLTLCSKGQPGRSQAMCDRASQICLGQPEGC